ncbi:uncharacterized protein HMPREF1541_09609 [Cyphellophora europaea CBS 101466]|uniref:Uncharacterized protein n=1 Tax=Cyphellophora europaea (strain CBS 101466) TaxID=1220924 RepID=W2SAM4_CYPE1|nr:uncharacterized protein HMPREF1541_09609 [Cyphellophora europaea CBS 101466]ETN45776.1 hypothetical protein HMPREF1541_09609 [Cyphellophora europaea CBS 101466]
MAQNNAEITINAVVSDLDLALITLGVPPNHPIDHVEARKRYHQLMSDNTKHQVQRQLYRESWATIKRHVNLGTVQRKISHYTDVRYFPRVDKFLNLASELEKVDVRGEDGPCIMQTITDLNHYEKNRWLDLEDDLNEYERIPLEDASKLLGRLRREIDRIDLMYSELKFMALARCKILPSGRVVPKYPNAGLLFRSWYEARRVDDMRDLAELSGTRPDG